MRAPRLLASVAAFLKAATVDSTDVKITDILSCGSNSPVVEPPGHSVDGLYWFLSAGDLSFQASTFPSLPANTCISHREVMKKL